MPTVPELRARLTEPQRQMLAEIVSSWLRTEKGPTIRGLHLRNGGRQPTLDLLEEIGGSVIWEVEDHQAGHRYDPKLLGILMSPDGDKIEDLLASYVMVIEDYVNQDNDRHQVTSAEIAATLKLNLEESKLLYRLINLAGLLGRSGGSSPDGTWTVGIFDQVDELGQWPDKREFVRHLAVRDYDPALPVTAVGRRAYAGNGAAALPEFAADPWSFGPEGESPAPILPATNVEYVYEPDPEKLVALVAALQANGRYRFEMVRHVRGGARKTGKLKPEALRDQLAELEKLELDLYYRPGNPALGGWASLDLEFGPKLAQLRCLGAYEWFLPVLDHCVAQLGLVKSHRALVAEHAQKAEALLAPALFQHVKGSIRDGNHPAALSAAVVFVEDRLRTKIGPAGHGLAGSDLVVKAYKNPGLLAPPLAFAENAQENAFLLVKGWFGFVRNLHGHQASFPISFDEAFAQLAGANYVLWVIENSTAKPPANP